MALIKKITEEKKKLKLALEQRVLKLYREIQDFENRKSENLQRIYHLEEQIDKIGGEGVDIDKVLGKY